MMERLAQWAWIFGIAGILVLGFGGTSYFLMPENHQQAWILIGAGGALLGIYAAADRDRLSEGVSARSTQKAGGALTLIALAGVLCVGLYILAVRYDHTWDLTRDQAFTLSEQSVKVVSTSAPKIKIYGFFARYSPGSRQFQNLMKSFKQVAPDLSVEEVDPLRDPLKAQEFKVSTEWGSVVIVQGAREERLEDDFSEKAFVNAIIRLQSEKDHRICWSAGHGESGTDDDETRDGMGQLILKLEDQNYQVTKSLIATEGVDPNCEALVIAWPVQDFFPHELEAIAAYVAGGGRLLALVEPDLVSEVPYAPAFTQDLERYGIHVGNDVVLEPNPSFVMSGDRPFDLILRESSFTHHPITQGLRAVVSMPTTRSVTPIADAAGIEATVLASSTPESWAETVVNQDPIPDGDEVRGPVSVGVAVEVVDPAVLRVVAHEEVPAPTDVFAVDQPPPAGFGVPKDFSPKPGGRVVVFGDADFASNRRLILGNNQDLVLNTLAWLVDEEAQLGERADNAADQRITLTGLEFGVLLLVSLLLVPGAAALMALVVLLRRRLL